MHKTPRKIISHRGFDGMVTTSVCILFELPVRINSCRLIKKILTRDKNEKIIPVAKKSTKKWSQLNFKRQYSNVMIEMSTLHRYDQMMPGYSNTFSCIL